MLSSPKRPSIFRRDRSSTIPSRDPSFLVVLHSSVTRSVSRLIIVRSVLTTLMYRNQWHSAVGTISFTLLRYSWSVEIKSASFAYIASLGKLWSAGGLHGRHPRSVRRAASRSTTKSTGDNESPCREPTVELNGADRASSTLTVVFVSNSRSRVIQTLSVSRNEYKTSRSFFRRIVSNAREKYVCTFEMLKMRGRFASF